MTEGFLEGKDPGKDFLNLIIKSKFRISTLGEQGEREQWNRGTQSTEKNLSLEFYCIKEILIFSFVS